MKTITNEAKRVNDSDLKISIPDPANLRLRHIQPGMNGLGEASVFARELHKVVPELYYRRWS